MSDISSLPIEHIVSRLSGKQYATPSGWGTEKQAAVLVPLLQAGDGWHLLFTKRTDFLATHKGQISFPGGKAEPGDVDAYATALRETDEEIGVGTDRVNAIGKLDDFITHYGVVISPVVGIIRWPITFKLSVDEVSRVFTIPLDWFANPSHLETREYIEPGKSPRNVLYYKEYKGDEVWGITAYIIHNLVQSLKK